MEMMEASARLPRIELHREVGDVRRHTEAILQGSASLLLRVLDSVEHCFAFFDLNGALRHANRAMLQQLATSPENEFLRKELADFARVVAGMAKVRRLTSAVERLAGSKVQTSLGEYVFDGIYAGADLLGQGACVVVNVRVPPPDPFSGALLARRFKLTRQQAMVARLLAEGLRNDEIARRLTISEHTARHHVEQVKLKVAAPTRAAVAARILDAELSCKPR